MLEEALSKTKSRIPKVKGTLKILGQFQIDNIAKICQDKGIVLLEDCAHAHGSQLSGIKAGNLADGGGFSFFPTKVMTTMEGGMVLTNNKILSITHTQLAGDRILTMVVGGA